MCAVVEALALVLGVGAAVVGDPGGVEGVEEGLHGVGDGAAVGGDGGPALEAVADKGLDDGASGVGPAGERGLGVGDALAVVELGARARELEGAVARLAVGASGPEGLVEGIRRGPGIHARQRAHHGAVEVLVEEVALGAEHLDVEAVGGPGGVDGVEGLPHGGADLGVDACCGQDPLHLAGELGGVRGGDGHAVAGPPAPDVEREGADAALVVLVEAGLEGLAPGRLGRAREGLAGDDEGGGQAVGGVRAHDGGGQGLVLEVVEGGDVGRGEEGRQAGRGVLLREEEEAVPHAVEAGHRHARRLGDRHLHGLGLERGVEEHVRPQIPLARLVVGQAPLVHRHHRHLGAPTEEGI